MKELVAKGLLKASSLFAGLAMVVDSRTVVAETQRNILRAYQEQAKSIQNRECKPEEPKTVLDTIKDEKKDWANHGYL